MKLKPNEVLVLEEDIHPQARAEVEAIHKELDKVKDEAFILEAQLDALKAKASYLSKSKWVVFDKYHPRTSPRLHPDKDGKEYYRKYDWEGNKIGVVEKPDDPASPKAVAALKELFNVLSEDGPKELKIEVPVAP